MSSRPVVCTRSNRTGSPPIDVRDHLRRSEPARGANATVTSQPSRSCSAASSAATTGLVAPSGSSSASACRRDDVTYKDMIP